MAGLDSHGCSPDERNFCGYAPDRSNDLMNDLLRRVISVAKNALAQAVVMLTPEGILTSKSESEQLSMYQWRQGVR